MLQGNLAVPKFFVALDASGYKEFAPEDFANVLWWAALQAGAGCSASNPTPEACTALRCRRIDHMLCNQAGLA